MFTGWKREYILLWLCTFLHLSAAISLFAFSVQLVRWNFGSTEVAILAFVMDGMLVAARPFVKWFLDRFHTRTTLLVSSVLLMATGFAMAFAGSDLWLLGLSRLLHGFGLSLMLVAYVVHASHILPAETMHRGLSWLALCAILPQMLVIPIAEHLIETNHTFFYYAFLTLSGLLAAGCAFGLSPVVAHAEEGASFRQLLRIPFFQRILALTFAQNAIGSLVQTFIPILATGYGVATSAFFIPYALGSLLTRGALASWIGTRRQEQVIFLCMIGIAIGAGGLAFAKSALLLGVFGLWYGVFQGPMDPALMSLTSRHFATERNAAFTGYMTAQDSAWAFSPLLGGLAGKLSVASIYLLSGVAGALGALASWRWFRNPSKS